SDDFDILLATCVADVHEGHAKSRNNPNVTVVVNYDLRRVISRENNKSLRVYRKAHDMTLTQVSQALVDAFNADSEEAKAMDVQPLTVKEYLTWKTAES